MSAVAPGPGARHQAQAGDAEDIAASPSHPGAATWGWRRRGTLGTWPGAGDVPCLPGRKGGLDRVVPTSIQVPGGDTYGG